MPSFSSFACQFQILLHVQFSRSVISDYLWPHGLQHARLPCLSPTPTPCSNSCPTSWYCHPTISSSVISFSFHFQYFPASGSFLKSHFFTSGSQSFGDSASVSVFPMNIQDWFPLGLTYWISCIQGTLKNLLQHSSKASIFWRSVFFMAQLSHSYMTTGKTIAWTIWTFVGKVISLLFNMLSRLVIFFLPRSKRLLISWLQSPPAVILEPPQKIKSFTVSTVSPSIWMKWWDRMPWS